MAVTNLERYQKDLDILIKEASQVELSLLLQISGRKKLISELTKHNGGDELKATEIVKAIKPFIAAYQPWYSEALPLVKQLLPDRLTDFIRLYEKPKTRKDLDFENYRIEDACQGIQTTYQGEVKADASAARTLLEQQIAIVKAIKRRFESSLFDIKQLVQADLFDSELGAARELLKNKFYRAAGAIAGVVLEGHLKQVCDNHKIPKKSGTITPMNEGLKAADVLDLAQYRHIQFLGDIRNKCGHKNTTDPTADEVEELINGADKVIKTIF